MQFAFGRACVAALPTHRQLAVRLNGSSEAHVKFVLAAIVEVQLSACARLVDARVHDLATLVARHGQAWPGVQLVAPLTQGAKVYAAQMTCVVRGSRGAVKGRAPYALPLTMSLARYR